MNTYLIGSIVKEYRIRLNISQEELCNNLCAVSTLSRIESCNQIPRRKLIEALFSRMGINPPTSGIPMSSADFKRENLEFTIYGLVSRGCFNIKSLLDEYKDCSDCMDVLEKQFYCFYRALYDDAMNHDSRNALTCYIDALRLTAKDYRIERLPEGRLFTRIEVLILISISRTLYFLDKKDNAIAVMEFLRSYFERGIVSEEEKAKNYPVILFNLENWYGLDGKNELALALCEKGIDACIQYGPGDLFPYHIYNKGCALIRLGKTADGLECLKRAVYFMEEMKKYEDARHGRLWVMENFGISI